MAENQRKNDSAVTAATFCILNVLLYPITLPGYVIWGDSLFSKRGLAVFATAQRSLSTRCFEHNIGTRQSDPANPLLPVLRARPRWDSGYLRF